METSNLNNNKERAFKIQNSLCIKQSKRKLKIWKIKWRMKKNAKKIYNFKNSRKLNSEKIKLDHNWNKVNKK